MISIAMPFHASAAEASARRDRLKPVALSDADVASIVAALNHVREQLDTFEAADQKIASDPTLADVERVNRILDSHRTRDALLDSAAANVLAALSLDGRQRLDAYVKGEVKRHITIYGGN